MALTTADEINLARKDAKQFDKPIRLGLDKERRVTCYPLSGLLQERLIEGIGWVLADDEDWSEVEEAIAAW